MKKTQSTGGSLGDLHFEYFDTPNSKIFNTEKLIEATKEEDFTDKGKLEEIFVFLSGKSQYHSHTKNKSGISLDFGFCSFGHSSEKESDVKNDSRFVQLLIQAKRQCGKKRIDNADVKRLMNEEALNMLNEAPYEFYKRYGSYYVTNYYTGLYAQLLLTLKCSSSEEAEGKKSEWKASFEDEDKSGNAGLSNSNGFQSFCSKNGVTAIFSHNISNQVIQDFEKTEDTKISSLKGRLLLIENMSKLDKNDANPIEVTYSKFDFPKEQFDLILSNNNFINDNNLMKEYELSEFVLNQIDDFETNKSNYQKITDINIDEVKTYHKQKTDAISKLIRHLNQDLENHEDDLKKEILTILEDKDGLNKKLELRKQSLDLKLSTKSTSEDIEHIYENLIDKNKGENKKENFYNPKFAASDKVKNNKDHHAYGLVIYNSFPINSSENTPNSSTTWAFESFNQDKNESDKNKNAKALIEWMKEHLSPNQYLHCSIVRTDKDGAGSTITVIYPEI